MLYTQPLLSQFSLLPPPAHHHVQFKPAKVALKYGGIAIDNNSVRKYMLVKDIVLKYSTDEELGIGSEREKSVTSSYSDVIIH